MAWSLTSTRHKLSLFDLSLTRSSDIHHRAILQGMLNLWTLNLAWKLLVWNLPGPMINASNCYTSITVCNVRWRWLSFSGASKVSGIQWNKEIYELYKRYPTKIYAKERPPQIVWICMLLYLHQSIQTLYTHFQSPHASWGHENGLPNRQSIQAILTSI